VLFNLISKENASKDRALKAAAAANASLLGD